MTAPSNPHSATIAVAEVLPGPTISKRILFDKPLPPDPPKDMAKTTEATGPNDDPATADFEGDLNVTGDIPSKSTWEKAGSLPVLNVDGMKVPFKTLYEGIDGEKKGQRVMIIFIRHFFCGVRIFPSTKLKSH
jgi:hypothetical protein